MIKFRLFTTIVLISSSLAATQTVNAQCFRNLISRLGRQSNACSPSNTQTCPWVYETYSYQVDGCAGCWPEFGSSSCFDSQACGSDDSGQPYRTVGADPVTQQLNDIKTLLEEIQRGKNPDPLDPNVPPNLIEIKKELDKIKTLLDPNSAPGPRPTGMFSNSEIFESLARATRLAEDFRANQASTHAGTKWETRIWQDNSGKYSTEGRLLSFTESEIEIETTNGKTCLVALSRLSLEDQNYVARLKATKESEPTIGVASL